MFTVIVLYSDATSTTATFPTERMMWAGVEVAQRNDAYAIYVYDENSLRWSWGGAFEE